MLAGGVVGVAHRELTESFEDFDKSLIHPFPVDISWGLTSLGMVSPVFCTGGVLMTSHTSQFAFGVDVALGLCTWGGVNQIELMLSLLEDEPEDISVAWETFDTGLSHKFVPNG